MSYEGVRFGQDIQKTYSVRILNVKICVEKTRESLSMLIFCKYVIFLVNISIHVFRLILKNLRLFSTLQDIGNSCNKCFNNDFKQFNNIIIFFNISTIVFLYSKQIRTMCNNLSFSTNFKKYSTCVTIIQHLKLFSHSVETVRKSSKQLNWHKSLVQVQSRCNI